MPSLLNETRIGLGDLARENGVTVSAASRWCLNGVRGHRLESVRVGGRVVTSREAFERWLTAINDRVTVAGGAT